MERRFRAPRIRLPIVRQFPSHGLAESTALQRPGTRVPRRRDPKPSRPHEAVGFAPCPWMPAPEAWWPTLAKPPWRHLLFLGKPSSRRGTFDLPSSLCRATNRIPIPPSPRLRHRSRHRLRARPNPWGTPVGRVAWFPWSPRSRPTLGRFGRLASVRIRQLRRSLCRLPKRWLLPRPLRVFAILFRRPLNRVPHMRRTRLRRRTGCFIGPPRLRYPFLHVTQPPPLRWRTARRQGNVRKRPLR